MDPDSQLFNTDHLLLLLSVKEVLLNLHIMLNDDNTSQTYSIGFL